MRSLLTILAAAALSVSGVAPALAAGPATARLLACQGAAAPASGDMDVQGRMFATGANQRLSMRIGLLRRTDAGTFKPLIAEGLGEWTQADPGVTRYGYRKRIRNLAAPGAYRARISFRWTAAATGRVVRRAERRTAICRQSDPRADLKVVGLRSRPGIDGSDARYTVTVHNSGRRAANAFNVQVAFGAVSRPGAIVDRLPPGTSRQLIITAPPCAPGEELRATVDAENGVDEAREDNNLRLARCPGAAD